MTNITPGGTWHHPNGEAWWWQHHAMAMFFNGSLVRIKGNLNGAKYKEILDENQL
jgi:hypothetical protein